MFNIEIEFFGPFREITNERRIKLTLSTQSSLRDVIAMLVEKYGEDFKNRVYDKNNVLKESTGIILNNSIVSSLDTTISDGDKIVFTIAPISGG